MTPNLPFTDLMARVRAREEAAAAELVRQYEPEVRRLIRVMLSSPNLRRLVDSADICQSVLAAFFVRVAAGQYDLAEPVDLVRLLAQMARHKLFDHARKPAARRSRSGAPEVFAAAPSGEETPSDVASHKELLAEALRRLSPEERAIADLRAAGLGWAEVAAESGLTPEAARKKLTRAIDRVCEELGIDRVPNE